jgi:tetratricopeptide (TPR) repeat protein
VRAAEYDKSLVEMEKGGKKIERMRNLLHTLATLYSLNDRFEDAIEAGNAALKKGKLKRRDQALLAIGNAELSLGKFDAAIKSFREAAKDERSNSLAKQYITFAEREKARVASLKQG